MTTAEKKAALAKLAYEDSPEAREASAEDWKAFSREYGNGFVGDSSRRAFADSYGAQGELTEDARDAFNRDRIQRAFDSNAPTSWMGRFRSWISGEGRRRQAELAQRLSRYPGGRLEAIEEKMRQAAMAGSRSVMPAPRHASATRARKTQGGDVLGDYLKGMHKGYMMVGSDLYRMPMSGGLVKVPDDAERESALAEYRQGKGSSAHAY